MGDSKAEGSSAIGDGGQASISLTVDAVGMHMFASLKVHNLKVHM